MASASELGRPLASRLGTKTAKALTSKLGLETVGDLVHHFPRRCASRGELTPIAALEENAQVTILAEVVATNTRPMRHRKGSMFEVVVSDGTDHLNLTFFSLRGPHVRMRVGEHAIFSGKVTKYDKKLQLTHPEYQSLGWEGDVDAAQVRADEPIPIYPTVEGVSNAVITTSVRTLLDTIGDVPDLIPGHVLEAHGLMTRREALERIHRPRDLAEWAAALKRIKWDEAFVLQVELGRRRAEARAQPAQARSGTTDGLAAAFDRQLPFQLTEGQETVGRRISAELASPHPMNRLLQGEVGTGKTIVALRAMLTVVDSGGQAALLAPTEVLAQQHHRSITAMLGPLAQADELGGAEVATRVALLTGSQSAATRRAALDDVQRGGAGIVIGTHALLQQAVEFHDLGLVVVDEQHRFGVEQRDRLRNKAREGRTPHLLVMTATPIPRTIAMTVFGDLDVSTLTDVPPGRSGSTTHVVPADQEQYVARCWRRLREEVDKGHQAFVVCPRISSEDDPEDADLADVGDDGSADIPPSKPLEAVLDVLPRLRVGPLQGLRVESLHGRMPPEDKDDVMRRFAAGDIDVLVATTVVEVGVDVPNATAMVIMDSERFGMSQLHQLRGRVGRGPAPAVCLLITSAERDSPGGQRIQALVETNDGFALAERDLDLRREGDVLGRSQSGWRTSLRSLRVLRDRKIIGEAREAAMALVDRDPQLADHRELAAALAALVEHERAEFLERG